jgi:acetamidase/formamidase
VQILQPGSGPYGPHVVTGPISVAGAMPGDVLRVEVLRLDLRTPYGVVSNRHGLGALPGEFPETPAPESDAFIETDHAWVPIGLDADLNVAFAYLSAAADFEVSQVVDAVKGVHCVIRKADFKEW